MFSRIPYVQQVMHPEWYHGHGKKAPFFEGWYFKCINQAENQRWAFIPGIFIHDDPDTAHAFIQVLDGTAGTACYHRFPLQDFSAESDAFDVRIGGSRFTEKSIHFNVDDEFGTIHGDLRFTSLNPWPVTLLSPGIMGWYGWLNFLECYHGVVSLDHTIEGQLSIYGNEVDFSGGRGYIEKDWGKSFPTGYVWKQSNHFDTPGTSLTASIATIPNLGRTFPGYIAGLWHEGELYRFTTYNGSRVDKLVVDDNQVDWILSNRQYELRMVSQRARGGLLLGPEREDMLKRVGETMQATIEVELYRRNGSSRNLVFQGQGRNAGLEVIGDLSLLLKAE